MKVSFEHVMSGKYNADMGTLLTTEVFTFSVFHGNASTPRTQNNFSIIGLNKGVYLINLHTVLQWYFSLLTYCIPACLNFISVMNDKQLTKKEHQRSASAVTLDINWIILYWRLTMPMTSTFPHVYPNLEVWVK